MILQQIPCIHLKKTQLFEVSNDIILTQFDVFCLRRDLWTMIALFQSYMSPIGFPETLPESVMAPTEQDSSKTAKRIRCTQKRQSVDLESLSGSVGRMS